MKKILIAISAVVLVACSSLREEVARFARPQEAQFAVFLNGPEKRSHDITFTLKELRVLKEEEGYIQVLPKPLTLNSMSLMNQQLLLVETSLPSGKYRGLMLKLSQASLRREGKPAGLLIEEEVFLDIPFELFPRESTPIFLDWQVGRSLVGGFKFRPAFAARLKGPELRALLLYVTNEGSGNVSVIDRNRRQVVATVQVGEGPRGVVAGTREDRVYVANHRSHTISVIDTSTHRVHETINLQFGDRPEGLAITPDGDSLLVANYGSNTLSLVDTLSLRETHRIEVGNGPVAVAVEPQGKRAYVVNSLSSDLSVIDILTPKLFLTLPLESEPSRIAVDSQGKRIYITNFGSSSLSVVDGTTHQLKDSLQVGPGVLGVAVDSTGDMLYVAKASSQEVMGLRPSLNLATWRARAGTFPYDLALDPDGREIYVVNRGSHSLSVIDKITGRVKKTIGVGKRPYGVTVVK